MSFGGGGSRTGMTRVIAGMTTSLDGFVADESCRADCLSGDFEELRESAYMAAIVAETGAVLMGRRTFEMADDPDAYATHYEFQVPIFVVTHRPPDIRPQENDQLTFTFVSSGVEAAVAQAKAAAGDRAVTVVGGVNLIRQLLQAGLVDELQVDIMPVLLGAGLRMFDGLYARDVAIEKLGVDEIGARTSLRFRVGG